MSGYAQSERRSLTELLSQLGPDAPTLCEGWTTRDLAAHLVVRERRPDAAAGLVVPALREHGEKVRTAQAAIPYPDLVELVRRPPWWSPVSNPVTDGLANGLEFFIHHEDVRRARPGWQPRDLPAAQQAALWGRMGMLARMALRRFRAAVTVQAPEYGELQAGAGGQRVRLIGAPAELVMFLSGRQAAARVQIDGPADLSSRLRTAKLGL